MILLKSIYKEIGYGYANSTSVNEYEIRCPKETNTSLRDEHDSTAHEDPAGRECPDLRSSKTHNRHRYSVNNADYIEGPAARTLSSVSQSLD
jgi:hypothetical protein